MKQFIIEKDDFLIRCGIGSTVFFLIVHKDMFENWWEPNKKAIAELDAKVPQYEYDKIYFDFF